MVARLEKEVNSLTADLESSRKRQVDTQALAKTFESMKTEEMSPILRDIDDDTALNIYEKMSGRSRKKLLLALATDRAARLTRRIASGRN